VGEMAKILSFLAFGIFAGIGAAIDLAIFYTLINWGTGIVFSSIVSSSMGISVSQYLSRKYVFNGEVSLAYVMKIAAYYLVSVNVFAYFVESIHLVFGMTPFISKIFILPVSLLVNYAVINQIAKRENAKWPESS
jgi:hypothetical protein